MRLSKDDILKAEDIRTREVEVPEWSGSVLVRGMNGTERDAFETSVMVQRGDRYVRDTHNARARLIAQCVINDDGTLMFDVRDVEALGAKSAKALDRVFTAAAELSGLSEGDMEEMTANFGGSPGGGSSSSSPNGSDAPSKGF